MSMCKIFCNSCLASSSLTHPPLGCVCVLCAGVGATQSHGQHGGAAAGVLGGGPSLRDTAGGHHSALPLPAAALQGHEGGGYATAAAD